MSFGQQHFNAFSKCLTLILAIVLLADVLQARPHDPSRPDSNASVLAQSELDPLVMWYDQPAKVWMTEALPIGNGPMGAMLFGSTEVERIQFNEISLWSGDRVSKTLLGNTMEEELNNLGAYQAFGDVLIHLGHDFSKVTNYRRQLDIDEAVHLVEYDYEGV